MHAMHVPLNMDVLETMIDHASLVKSITSLLPVLCTLIWVQIMIDTVT